MIGIKKSSIKCLLFLFTKGRQHEKTFFFQYFVISVRENGIIFISTMLCLNFIIVGVYVCALHVGKPWFVHNIFNRKNMKPEIAIDRPIPVSINKNTNNFEIFTHNQC